MKRIRGTTPMSFRVTTKPVATITLTMHHKPEYKLRKKDVAELIQFCLMDPVNRDYFRDFHLAKVRVRAVDID